MGQIAEMEVDPKEDENDQPSAVIVPEVEDELDPETIAFNKAHEALKEETDKSAEETPKAKTEGDVPKEKPAKAAEEPEKQLVPLAALHEERKARQTLVLNNAALQGQVTLLNHMLKARAAAPQGSAPETVEGSPVQETPKQKIQTLRQKVLDLGKEFDAGHISREEELQQQFIIQDEIDQIREEVLLSKVPKQDTQDVALEQFTERLNVNYPILYRLGQAQLDPIEEIVYQKAELAGNPIPATALGTMRLRKEMAVIAVGLYGEDSPPTAPSQIEKPKQRVPTKLSPEAQKREEKLRKAADAPPNLSNVGSSAQGLPQSDEEVQSRLTSFTDEEDRIDYLKNLPAATRKRLGL